MTINVTLATVGNLIDATTAQTTINNNSGVIVTAFENALNTSGDQMEGNLDMDSNHLLNLPAPATADEPLRLQDLSTFNGGGTVTNIPAGGTTNQVLAKSSNADFAVQWTSEAAEVLAGTNIVVTGSAPVTVSTVASPTFTAPILGTPASGTLTNCVGLPIATGVANLGTGVSTFLTTPTSTNLRSAVATTSTGTGSLVFNTSPTFVTPALGSPASGNLQNCTGLPVASGISGMSTFAINLLSNGLSSNLLGLVGDGTGSGANVFATSPALVTPNLGVATATSINGSTVSPGHYTGEPSTGSAVAGQIGEYISSTVLSGSAVPLTSGTAANITSISLTAGDWDVDSVAYLTTGTSTSYSNLISSLSTTTAALNTAPGQWFGNATAAQVAGTGVTISSAIPPFRFSLASTTTIFLVVSSSFTVSTMSAYGILRARRMR